MPPRACTVYLTSEKSKEVMKVLNSLKLNILVVSGDGIACNAKRGLAALISVKDESAYHLFDCSLLKVKKKAKWHSVQKRNEICYA